MHLDDGQLRAYADNALAAPERAAAAEHLSRCDDCRQRARELAAQGERVDAHLAMLAPSTDATDVSAALSRLRRRRDFERKENVVFKQIFSRQFRLVWVGLAAIVLALVVFSFEPVQAWAGQFLSLFRVEQVTVLPVDTTGLSQMGNNPALAKQLSQMISKSVTVTKKPSSPQQVDSAAAASQLAGFNVRLPTSQTTKPQITVTGGTAFQVVADRAKAQAVLDETGHSNLVLPASLDGAVIKVNIPASVNVGYGTCPTPQVDSGQSSGNKPNPAGPESQLKVAGVVRSAARAAAPSSSSGDQSETHSVAGPRLADCVMLVEMPSPTVDAPPNIDVQQLAEIALQFTGMSAEQAKSYSQTVDWASTLVIPIPQNGASYKQVNVDGVTGFLIQRPVNDAAGYALVWVKSGIIYAIAGLNNDTPTAISMANSLK